MSPEQVRHDVLMIDRRSDIWAIGVVLSELVHGRRPFPQKDRDKLFHEIQTGEPLIESARETHELDRVIRRCLSKEPTDRYPTAESLAKQLQDLHNRCFSSGAKKWLYGTRRKLVVLFSLAVLTASFWGYLVLEKQSRVRLTFSQIKNASISSLPSLLGKLRQLKPAPKTLAADLETPTAVRRQSKESSASCKRQMPIKSILSDDAWSMIPPRKYWSQLSSSDYARLTKLPTPIQY